MFFTAYPYTLQYIMVKICLQSSILAKTSEKTGFLPWYAYLVG